MKICSLLTAAILGALLLQGCSGPIAKSGWATVTGLSPDGVMRLDYAEGKAALKRVNPDNVRKETQTVAKNLQRPARYVETSQGSTLTFPCGDTVTYYDMKCE